MDILDYAMKMEKDGESYYREQAGRVGDRNAAMFLGFLAREEVRHYEIFRKLKEGVRYQPESTFVTEVKSLFEKMKERGETFSDQGGGIVEVLQHAQEIEDRTVRYYREKEKEAGTAELKQTLRALVREEDRHYSIIGDILDYYLKPQLWNEQAEFNHLDTY